MSLPTSSLVSAKATWLPYSTEMAITDLSDMAITDLSDTLKHGVLLMKGATLVAYS